MTEKKDEQTEEAASEEESFGTGILGPPHKKLWEELNFLIFGLLGAGIIGTAVNAQIYSW